MESPKIIVEETNLEDLIILGENKKIPIIIEYPNGEKTIKAKALIKQITLQEMETIKLNKENILQTSLQLLQKCLFKSNGEPFTPDEITTLPLGVVNTISEKIMELSGVNKDKELQDF